MKFSQYTEFKTEGGGFLNLKQGENKVRVVSEFEHFLSDYQGRKNDRFMGYVIDRTDGQIKLLTIGKMIFGELGEYSTSAEFGFTDVPPYDVVIKKTGEGKETDYKVIPARQNTELTAEEKKQVSELKSVSEVIDAMVAKTPDKYFKVGIKEDIEVDYDEKEPIDSSNLPF